MLTMERENPGFLVVECSKMRSSVVPSLPTVTDCVTQADAPALPILQKTRS